MDADFETTVEATVEAMGCDHIQSPHPDKTLKQLEKKARMQAHDLALAQVRGKSLAQRKKAWFREAQLWASDTGSDADDYEFFVPRPRD